MPKHSSKPRLNCHALVVGVDTYEQGIAPLKSAVGDANAIAELLSQQHNYSVSCLTDGQATRQSILAELSEKFASSLTKESSFLLYFAGHGLAVGDGSDGPQGYLLPQDAAIDDDSRWLSMQTLKEQLEALPCRHLLVVLDCCFAGSFRWASTRDVRRSQQPLYNSQLDRYLTGVAWHALTSASHDEKAADVMPGRSNLRDTSNTQSHSPFAHALLQGLGGAADSSRGGHEPDGVITATELYQYVFEKLIPPGAPQKQTPGIWPLKHDNKGEYVFINPEKPINTQPDPPLDDKNNPWLGLNTYSVEDKDLFFGRQRVIKELLWKTRNSKNNFLSVVGASGTGKSSVVKAGLLPQLHQEGETQTHSVIHAPRLQGNAQEQLAQITEQLRDSGNENPKILFIDQFEELYTQCSEEAVRNQFLQGLRRLIDDPSGPFVIITLRSDFEPRPKSSDALKDIWQDARYVVPGFTSDELRNIIEGPARIKALFFDPPEVVSRLLEEILAMPGGLPLLSFALAEMYRTAQHRRRETGATDRSLTLEDYHAAGGVVGALHKRATLLYEQSKDDQERDIIRRLFLRLTNQEGARLTRRRINTTELEFDDPDEQQRMNEVVNRFVSGRLLVKDEDVIEPAHDTLVVAWDKLQKWLADSGSQELIRSVWRDAREWKEKSGAKNATGYLWHNDPRLPQAQTISSQLNRLEKRFVEASSKKRKSQRRLLTGITLSVIAALAFATLYSVLQAKKATEQTEIAVQQLAEARYANGRALLEQARQRLENKDHLSASLLAAQALGFRGYGVNAETRDEEHPELISSEKPEFADVIKVLTNANQRSARLIARRNLGATRFSPKGSYLAGITPRNTLELWTINDGTMDEIEIPASDGPNQVFFSKDDSMLGLMQPKQIRVWTLPLNPQDKPKAIVDNHEARLTGATFGPTQDQIVGINNQKIFVWSFADSVSSTQPIVIDGDEIQRNFAPHSLVAGSDGESIIFGGWHNRITRFNLSPRCVDSPSGIRTRPRRCFETVGPKWAWDRWSENVPRGDHVTALAYHPDASHLAAASANRLLMGQVQDQQILFQKNSHLHETRREITALAYSPDGNAVAIASIDGVVVLSFPEREVIANFSPVDDTIIEVSKLSFDDSGTILAYGDRAHTEFREVGLLQNQAFEISEEHFEENAHNLASAARLKQLLGDAPSDELWTAIQRVVGKPIDRQSVKFEQTDFGVRLEGEENFGLRFAAQSEPGSLIAIAADRFSSQGGLGQIVVYDAKASRVLMHFVLPEDQWGVDGMSFGVDSQDLLVKTSNFDGFFFGAYRWPMKRPNLTRYATLPLCVEPPMDLPVGHTFSPAGLLSCP